MKDAESITISAPLHKVFLAAADLTRWPEFLPHYRHNRFLSQTPSGGVVEMSCVHARVPLTWTCHFRIDPQRHELHFTHLRSTLDATGGVETTWSFEDAAVNEVRVTIIHRFPPAWPVVGPVSAHKIFGEIFLRRISLKTLAGLKRKVEAQPRAEVRVIPAKKMTPAKRKSASPAAKSPRQRRQKAPPKAAKPKSPRKKK